MGVLMLLREMAIRETPIKAGLIFPPPSLLRPREGDWKMWRNLAFSLLAFIYVLAPGTASAQQRSADGVYIIFDGSGSMWGQLADKVHKITAARSVLKEFVSGDFGEKELALRVYGHRRKGDCSDTELVVPFASSRSSVSRMQEFVDKISPQGQSRWSRRTPASTSGKTTNSGKTEQRSTVFIGATVSAHFQGPTTST